MRKKIAFMLLVFLVVFVTACSGKPHSSTNSIDNGTNSVHNVSTPESTDPSDLIIVESGYSINDSGYGNIYAHYGIIINNPNTDFVASLPSITITAKGSDGAILGTSEQYLFSIAPEDTVSFGGQIDCNGSIPASVDFSLSCNNYTASTATTDTVKSSDFVISNTSEILGSYGNVSYTGEIENIGTKDSSMVAVTVLLKNNGSIIYGNTTYINDLLSGSKKAFEISAYNVPEHTEYIISAQVWSL